MNHGAGNANQSLHGTSQPKEVRNGCQLRQGRSGGIILSKRSLRDYVELLLPDYREIEYQKSIAFLGGCNRILDAACGTGTFLAALKGKDVVGVDLNPDNVNYCIERGLNAQVGSILDLPYADESFDGVHCSHVMQVFPPPEAAQLVRELGRVLRPNGVLVITTLNWFPRFFRNPENTRPYPPDALRGYFAEQGGATSPMQGNMPKLEQTGIWFRRQPLIEFHSSRNHEQHRLCSAINRLQYKLFLRKYWSFDAYIICLKKSLS